MVATSGFFELIKPIIEVFAIIIGAIWAYKSFIRNRLHYPYAKISQQVTQIPLTSIESPKKRILLSVVVTLENTGNILIPLEYSETRVQQILPVHFSVEEEMKKSDSERKNIEFSWPELGFLEKNWKKSDAEIEPGESEIIEYEFIIDSPAKVVKVFSFIKNEKKSKSGLGWQAATICSLQTGDNKNE